jgi:hypothetical protein
LHLYRTIPMHFAVVAIVVAAPFERPLVGLPGGFTLTTVEAVVIVASALIALRLGPDRLLRASGLPLLLPGTAFLLALAVAAVLAPTDTGNALRFVARMLMAAIVFVLTLRALDTYARARMVAQTMVIVATVVAAIAVLEATEVPAVVNALTVFRPGFHVVGGQLRATSTLFYPTIASMYLEVAFVVGLWLLLDGKSDGASESSGASGRSDVTHPPHSPHSPYYYFIALVIIAAGITATFTRAGLLAMAAAITIVAVLRLSRVPPKRAGLATLTALSATIFAIVLVSHSPELLATRLTTEGSQAWYGARYEVPGRLELNTGGVHRVLIVVTNTGRLAWDSSSDPPFAMAYHWLRAESDEVVQFDGARTPFPSVVLPGRSVSFQADVIAPGRPGAYTLVWDVVHETRAWLSTEGVPPGRSQAIVSGAPVAEVTTTMHRLPAASVIPTRLQLWDGALRIAADRPWLGVGPDNYRHVYGTYLGIAHWDHRVHANNSYLDILAGAGVVGLLSMLWLAAAAGITLWRRVRQAPASAHVAAVSALAGWVVIAGHGLVDSFLSFTTTYVTFAVAAALALSPGLIAGSETDAHRV